MKKILFIIPHLSTGGLPQVVLNKVELLKSNFEIKCVEYDFLGSAFVIQRNKLIKLVGEDKLITLPNENKNLLLDIIKNFDPDVISMEEFPEFFMSDEVTKHIYSKERKYTIIETTHDSSFNPAHKKWFPDKFIFVSAFNAFKFSSYDIPYEIIEYPVDKKVPNKLKSQKDLGFDPEYKHVVCVGLFTRRKNQGYLFEIAKKLTDKKVLFHFIGNQAENFAEYWAPLINNKPSNCVIWGERSDVDIFLQASDMFFFPSKGDKFNKELNPIAIKEALSYGLSSMIFNLDVYCGKYDNEKNIKFLTGDLTTDTKILFSALELENKLDEEEVIIISTYPNTLKRIDLTKKCIESLKKLGRKIILTSHYPVPLEVQNIVDYYVFDSRNILTTHSYYNYFFNNGHNFDLRININNIKNSNQSLAAHMNFYNGFKFAKSIGAKRAMIITYDVILDNLDIPLIEDYFNKLVDWKCCIAYMNTDLGLGVETTSMVFNVDYFIKIFKEFKNDKEYNDHCKTLQCENFLENYYMTILKNEEKLWVVPNQKTILPNSGIGISSNSEYYSVLSVNNSPNEWIFYFHSFNLDERKIKIDVEEDSKVIFEDIFIVSESPIYMKKIFFKDKPVNVYLTFFDGDEKIKNDSFHINETTLIKYKDNGFFKEKNKQKIKLVHLQTTVNDEREISSYNSISKISDYDIEYVLHKNKLYSSLPPKESCLRPHCVSMELFDDESTIKLGTALTPAHYGCYESFKNGILKEFDSDVDFLIVCEGDCILEVPMEEFVSKIYECGKLINDNDIGYFSFGDVNTLDYGWKQSNIIKEIPNQNLIFITDKIIGLQCVMFPKSHREFLFDKLNNHKWDAADIYFNIIFNENNKKMAILKQRITTQADGYSFIDNQYKIFTKNKTLTT